MPQSATSNRRLLLVSRPHGLPAAGDFRMEEGPVPEVEDGQVLARTLWLSLDPYMRGRMNAEASYASSVELGEVMVGETVARVERSLHPHLHEGDLVLAPSGWQDYAALKGTAVRKLPANLERPSYALGVMGMPGLTAYVGLLDIGQPKSGETVVVGAAAGAVGSVVGQLAKIHGCRAVGVAGWPEKCEYVVQELGFDACVDHHNDTLAQVLAEACPQGVDVYFESVGGATTEAVVPLLNLRSRIPVCGLVSYYSTRGDSTEHDAMPLLLRRVLTQRIVMTGFIVSDHYATRYADFVGAMGEWLRQGRIKYREDVIDGLEQAPLGLSGLLRGDNFGKLVVRVGDA